MKYQFRNPSLKSLFVLNRDVTDIDQQYLEDRERVMLTIAWNVGVDQTITIDGIKHDFPNQVVIPLMGSDSFEFSDPKSVIAWQFNREFYCIIDHDKEVSCAGFIFYGSNDHLFVTLDETYQRRFRALLQDFEDEFSEKNQSQEEMLRMLLKRLIILVTRLGKRQYLSSSIEKHEEDIIRKFNVMVEDHYKQYHQVQDYANLLNKAPKTLSNLFSKYSDKSPLQVIQDRVILEAKRQLYYTDKSSKEISFDLGFEDPATFSRFFKKYTSQSPTSFKKTVMSDARTSV